MDGIEWNAFDLPNIPIFTTDLTPELMDYLWARIEHAKVDQESCNKFLAGNISKS